MGEGGACPDLPVGMRVRGAHRLAAVLEDLDPLVVRPELGRLRGPDVDHGPDVGLRHQGKGHVVARREAQHPAGSGLALGPQQAVVDPLGGDLRPQGGVVVGEHERPVVGRIDQTVRPGVRRAQVAGRVVGHVGRPARWVLAAQPRPARPLGRDEHPLVDEGIEPAMGVRQDPGGPAVPVALDPGARRPLSLHVGRSGRALRHRTERPGGASRPSPGRPGPAPGPGSGGAPGRRPRGRCR